jgi:hypothetical protein
MWTDTNREFLSLDDISIEVALSRSQPFHAYMEKPQTAGVQKMTQQQLWANSQTHRLDNWSALRSVPVYTMSAARVIWSNPDIAIPLLGKLSGVPFSSRQHETLVELFGVQLDPDDGDALGVGYFPADVGRTIHVPDASRLLVLNPYRAMEPFQEIAVSGAGLNPSSADQRIGTMYGKKWHGYIDRPTAMIKAVVGRALQRKGLNTQIPIAVIEPFETPNRPLFVYGASSFIREVPHLDGTLLAAQKAQGNTGLEQNLRDRRLLLRHLANLEGLSVEVWLNKRLPQQSAETAAVLIASRLTHTAGRGNLAAGVHMDWGEAFLVQSWGWVAALRAHRYRRDLERLLLAAQAASGDWAIDFCQALARFDDLLETKLCTIPYHPLRFSATDIQALNARQHIDLGIASYNPFLKLPFGLLFDQLGMRPGLFRQFGIMEIYGEYYGEE